MEGTGIPSDLLISKVLHAHRLDLEVVHFEWTDLIVDGQWCRKSRILSINSKIISFDRIIYDEGVPCCVLSKLQVSSKIPEWTWLTGLLTKMPTVAVVEPELDWNNYQLKSSYQKCMWCFLYYLLLYSIQLYVIYIHPLHYLVNHYLLIFRIIEPTFVLWRLRWPHRVELVKPWRR